MRTLYNLAVVLVGAFVLFVVVAAVTNPTYQRGLTTRYQARETTRQVQAQEWNKTVRTNGPWLFGGLATVAVVFLGGKVWMDHQEQRTRRHETTEDHTTQRHLISAKRDVALAYIAACGDPGAYQGRLNGVSGVFLPESEEFVPLDVCRAELATAPTTALVRRQPQTINVPPAHERRFLIVGEREELDNW
jgi:hypothetical protein